jgi:type VI secretion system secreted protein Hcp
MAVDLFLKLDGIEGESLDSKHPKEIECLAWSWGMSTSAHIGGSGVAAGKVNVQDFSVTKYIDKATPTLLLNVCNGSTIATAAFVARKQGGKSGPVEYLKISFKEILVTSVSTGGSGGEDKFTENVTFAFEEQETVYTEQTGTGAAGSPARMKWNTAQNKGG